MLSCYNNNKNPDNKIHVSTGELIEQADTIDDDRIIAEIGTSKTMYVKR